MNAKAEGNDAALKTKLSNDQVLDKADQSQQKSKTVETKMHPRIKSIIQ
jgi:hypothetical protein